VPGVGRQGQRWFCLPLWIFLSVIIELHHYLPVKISRWSPQSTFYFLLPEVLKLGIHISMQDFKLIILKKIIFTIPFLALTKNGLYDCLLSINPLRNYYDSLVIQREHEV